MPDLFARVKCCRGEEGDAVTVDIVDADARGCREVRKRNLVASARVRVDNRVC